MSIDAVWLKFTAEQAKWFNEGVDTAKEILRKQEAELAAVTAERDELRRLLAKATCDTVEARHERDALKVQVSELRGAAELGLRYAEILGEPETISTRIHNVQKIKAALRGEVWL
jgi:hypothetical protein